MPHPHLKAILEAADKGYEDGWLRIHEDMANGERGDMLADYVAVNIREVVEDSEPDFESAKKDVINSLESAAERLMDTVREIERLRNPEDQ